MFDIGSESTGKTFDRERAECFDELSKTKMYSSDLVWHKITSWIVLSNLVLISLFYCQAVFCLAKWSGGMKTCKPKFATCVDTSASVLPHLSIAKSMRWQFLIGLTKLVI